MSLAHGSSLEPSEWLRRHAPLIRPHGRVLDVAAGNGRNSRWLAAQGWQVEAVDIDASALAVMNDLPGITTRIADIEAGPWPFQGRKFDAVVVCRYLHRPLLPLLAASLEADDVLIYETFMQGQEACGRPKNPDFLLRPDELLEAFAGELVPHAFEQGFDTVQQAMVQRICALGGSAFPAALAN